MIFIREVEVKHKLVKKNEYGKSTPDDYELGDQYPHVYTGELQIDKWNNGEGYTICFMAFWVDGVKVDDPDYLFCAGGDAAVVEFIIGLYCPHKKQPAMEALARMRVLYEH